MSITEAVDAVIVRHLGTSRFGPATLPALEHYWANEILNAHLNDTLTFGESSDTLKIEQLRREVRACISSIRSLSPGTLCFIPPSKRIYEISLLISAGNPGAAGGGSAFQNATKALLFLEEWLSELSKQPSFRKLARKGRNWRAASIAAACRVVWAEWQWQERGLPELTNMLRPMTEDEFNAALNVHQQKTEFLRSCAPRSEKHDCPGPFGRFLEDVFLTLGVTGREGGRVSAHSALRALADAQR